MIGLLIHGGGRMGHRVLSQAREHPDFEIAALISRTRPDDLGDVPWHASLDDVDEPIGLLIDFTLPQGAKTAAAWCARNGVPFLSGTTGLEEPETRALEEAGREVPVLAAPNLSQGVALVTSLVRQTAAVLGSEARIEITDIHHRHKVDAPSGTALALAAAAMEGRCGDSQPISGPVDVAALAQDDDGPLTFDSIREGEVIGEHTVAFSFEGEVIEITHKALDRDIFARGALRAGLWLVGQPPGFYTIADWLG